MEKLEKGELIILDNDKEYLVYDIINDNGSNYVYLSLNTEAVDDGEVMICKEIENNGEISLEILTNKNDIKRIADKLLDENGNK